MKLRIITSCFLFIFIFGENAFSQCVTPLVVVRHADTVTYTGNYFNTFTFPQADPAIGTLVEVRIGTVVSITSSFNIESTLGSPNVFAVRMDYDAYLTGPGIGSIDSTKRYNLGTRVLGASDGVPGSGPDFYQSPTQTSPYDSIIRRQVTSVAPFLGAGNVSFDYISNEFGTSSPLGGSVLSISPTTTIIFSVEYHFCNTWFLASDISYLTATKNGGKNVKLAWGAENEQSVRNYEVEVSEDGLHFTTVATVPPKQNANGKADHFYNYSFNTPKERLYFRVRQIELNGRTHLSPAKQITWKKEESLQLQVYPNPASGQFTIDFPKSQKSNWRVDIIAANGQLVQSDRFTGTDFGRMQAGSAITKGFYILRVTNENTREQFVKRLIIAAK
jgi:hypothetical protein